MKPATSLARWLSSPFFAAGECVFRTRWRSLPGTIDDVTASHGADTNGVWLIDADGVAVFLSYDEIPRDIVANIVERAAASA